MSQEDLRKAAEKLTAEKFGPVPGSAETYAYIYSLALSVDPMLFADGAAPVSPLLGAMVSEAVSRAEKAGNTVLFAGAEQYLPCLTDISCGSGGSESPWRWPTGNGKSLSL